MEDYKVRFVREYKELTERLAKLHIMLNTWARGELGFTPTCPRELLNEQAKAMGYYRDILEERAKLEEIDLMMEV